MHQVLLEHLETFLARRWIAAITERDVIERILEHPGLESVLPRPAPARASPQLALVFD